MSQPQGYVDLVHPDYVCKFHKAIYGLKQALRAWFDSFTFELFHLDFHSSFLDSNLFILHHDSFVVYLLLYVDDIIVTRNSPFFIDHLVSRLVLLLIFLAFRLSLLLKGCLCINLSMHWIY